MLHIKREICPRSLNYFSNNHYQLFQKSTTRKIHVSDIFLEINLLQKSFPVKVLVNKTTNIFYRKFSKIFRKPVLSTNIWQLLLNARFYRNKYKLRISRSKNDRNIRKESWMSKLTYLTTCLQVHFVFNYLM